MLYKRRKRRYVSFFSSFLGKKTKKTNNSRPIQESQHSFCHLHISSTLAVLHLLNSGRGEREEMASRGTRLATRLFTADTEIKQPRHQSVSLLPLKCSHLSIIYVICRYYCIRKRQIKATINCSLLGIVSPRI